MSDSKLLRIAMVGKSRNGKSCTGNTILRREVFEDSCETILVDRKTSITDDVIVQVFDTPGVKNSKLTRENDEKKATENIQDLMNTAEAIDVFILVLNSIYSSEEIEAVVLLEDILGQKHLAQHGMIAITHGENLDRELEDGETPEEKLNSWCSRQPESFKKLKAKMNDRIILVYNRGPFTNGSKRMTTSQQLLRMAREIHHQNGSYTIKDFTDYTKSKLEGKKRIRIALIGKTGHGKSSTGNTILRREVFEDSDTMGNSGTLLVEKKTAEINGLLVQVFDTPGLMHVSYDEKKDQKEAVKNMTKLMEVSQGIDVFLLVYNYTCKYTEEEKKVVENLEKIFGQTNLVNHGIIVVTHGENLESNLNERETPEEHFQNWCNKRPPMFQQLLKAMNDRIILVYNKPKGEFNEGTKRMQSSKKLLEMSEKLLNDNGSFTDDDFKELQRACCVVL